MKRFIGFMILCVALTVVRQCQAGAAETIDARAIPDAPITWACYFDENGFKTSDGMTKSDCLSEESEANDTLARWHFSCSYVIYVTLDALSGWQVRCRTYGGGVVDYYSNPTGHVWEIR